MQYLTCPGTHAPAALVASAWEQHDRRIVRGVLGCRVCGVVYAIRAGVADFGAAPPPGAAAPPAEQREMGEAPNEATAVRLAAQLDLTEPGRWVLLFGDYARLAPALSVMFDAQCFAVGMGHDLERHVAANASVLRIRAVVPLAHACLHGVAIDDAHVTRVGVDQVCALLRPRGRLVAPVGVPVPSGTTELAGDEREWVATRVADADKVVTLRRASR